MQTEKRRYKISYQASETIKAVAILFVIGGHLKITKFGMWESGCWGVGLFLFLSGYGIHESYKKNGLNDYWTKRLLKIYLPYIAVMVSEMLIDTLFFEKKYSVVATLKIFLGGATA